MKISKVLVIALALVLSACGDDDKGTCGNAEMQVVIDQTSKATKDETKLNKFNTSKFDSISNYNLMKIYLDNALVMSEENTKPRSGISLGLNKRANILTFNELSFDIVKTQSGYTVPKDKINNAVQTFFSLAREELDGALTEVCPVTRADNSIVHDEEKGQIRFKLNFALRFTVSEEGKEKVREEVGRK